MDIKDIQVGKTYRFKNEDTSPLGLIEFNGGTARVLGVDKLENPFPVQVDLAKDIHHIKYLSVKPEELEEL